jgi:peptide/nickel transport system ATP-binding protein
MNKGRIVETGSVGDIIKRPKEAYTIGLIDAIPSIRDETRRHVVPPSAAPIIKVEGLSREFVLSRSLLDRVMKRSGGKVVKAVQDVSFEIRKGSTYGLVGESGSGKSTCARMLVGLIPPTAGRVLLEGDDIWGGQAASSKRRQRVQMIFQDPYASLNPRWRVGDIVAEPIRALKLAGSKAEVRDRVADLLDKVRLDPVAMRKFPHEFSGGQRQRIAIARALSSQPEFIVCDEPTSALDVSVQAQVLDLMRALQDEYKLTYLLISHNLAVVRQMADDVGVMHNGVLVEQGPVDEIFDHPRAEYTRMLLDSVPDISNVE